MLITEVCKVTGLTKKAVEYYVEQGLVSPAPLENGYRDFDDADVEHLKKIRVLRVLGLGVEEIKSALADQAGTALKKLAVQRTLALQQDQIRSQLLDQLSADGCYEDIDAELAALDQSRVISERLLEAFPGYYGRFLCLHFARFLNEPIRTAEQQTAFRRVVDFLDQVPPPDFPDGVRAFFEEGTEQIGVREIEKMLGQVSQSMRDIGTFVQENRDALEQYLQYRQSDEYRNSPAHHLRRLLQEFCRTSGYYDTFLPAMMKLSPSYAAYRRQMEVANEKLLSMCPEIAELSEHE